MKLAKKIDILYFSFILFFISLASYIIGNRDLNIGTDTLTYYNIFLTGVACKCMGGHEFGFELFTYPMYFLSFTPPYIFTVFSLLIFFLVYLSSKKIVDNIIIKDNFFSKRNKYYLTLFSLVIITPLIIQTHINGIRQGISALFLLISFTYIISNNKNISLLYMLASISFHYSTFLIMPFYIIFFYFSLSINIIFISSIFIFIMLSIFYTLGFSENIVYSVSQFLNLPLWSLVRNYGAESDYRGGVRYDFFIFTIITLIPVFIYSINNIKARRYFSFVLISTFPFLLLGWGAYSNRYLLNTWIYITFSFGIYFLDRYKKMSSLSIVFFLAAISCNILFIYSN